MSTILRIDSIAQVHEMIGHGKPRHPLITLFEPAKTSFDPGSLIDVPIVSSLYSISLKNGHECVVRYGRQSYDFQEGSLIFLAPEQRIVPLGPGDDAHGSWNGWVLLFHPELLRGSALGESIRRYSFFGYDSHEALHVSEEERHKVTGIAETVREEYEKNLDDFSAELILSNLQLLLNYCKRFYGRQFITRKSENQDVLTRLEALLDRYFDSDEPELEGLPTVKRCAKELGYSPNYLSDLLRKETGKSTQEHIQLRLVDRAQNLLLSTQEPISTIAYKLGFEYPQHFSKLFKSKTGLSPLAYRKGS